MAEFFDGTVEVTPANWLQKNEFICLWPKLKGKGLERAIRNRKDLASEDFDKYDVHRILYKAGRPPNI